MSSAVAPSTSMVGGAGEVPPAAEAEQNSSHYDAQVKRNKPNGSRLRQQKLPAWQPILTAKTVIPTIFVVGALFIPIGIALLLASESVQEWSSYYEHCEMQRTCTITFNLAEPFTGNVYFYYGLENYFQNHRRYMKSRYDRQLLGNLEDLTGTSNHYCEPYTWMNTSTGKKTVAPCGTIANSMFNDTFSLQMTSPSTAIVPWTSNGLVWAVDKDRRFKNPPTPNGQSLCDVFAAANTIRPPSWSKDPCQLDLYNPDNNGFQNADFIVWMRTAALPDFRKPYRALLPTISSGVDFTNGLPAGGYMLTINNTYPVTDFSGRKLFIISTASWAGGKNSFLGIAYIIVGSICVLLGVIFFFIHIKFGHTLTDLSDFPDAHSHTRR